MAHEFCTILDSNYLPRGLVLYRSLVEHCPSFRLHVHCVDRETADVLGGLALPSIEILPLEELEEYDPRLREVKPDRTVAEYCWTAKASACLRLLNTEPAIQAVTYIDADLAFFGDPQPLFGEMGGDSVMIVPHRFATHHLRWEARVGPYNAGWVTFRNDERAREVLEWWHERCLEWCYARLEDGKMSDQKYLDDWPQRFTGIHVLEHPGGGLAPWNVSRYRLEERNERVAVDSQELVFYHYHALRFFEPRPVPQLVSRVSGSLRDGPLLWAADYPISATEERLIWAPYIRSFHAEWHRVRSLAPGASGGVARWSARREVARTPVGRRASTEARRLLNVPLERLSRLASSARSRWAPDAHTKSP